MSGPKREWPAKIYGAARVAMVASVNTMAVLPTVISKLKELTVTDDGPVLKSRMSRVSPTSPGLAAVEPTVRITPATDAAVAGVAARIAAAIRVPRICRWFRTSVLDSLGIGGIQSRSANCDVVRIHHSIAIQIVDDVVWLDP